MNKKLSLLLLLVCPLLRAETDTVVNKVAPLSEEHIESYYQEFDKREARRFTAQVMLGLGTTFALCYYIRQNFFGASEDSQIDKLRKEYSTLSDSFADFKKKVVFKDSKDGPAEESAPPASPGLLKRAWGGIKSTGSWVKGKMPSLARDLLYLELFSQANRMVGGFIPSVGNYLFEPRTMFWCINRRTQLCDSTLGLINWAANAVQGQSIDDDLLLQDLLVSMDCFVKDVEKILGYMRFMKGKLGADQVKEQRRASICMETITRTMNKMVTDTNEVLAGDRKKQEFALEFRVHIVKIVDEMSKFELVHKAAGYEDVMARDFFYMKLRAQILPEVYAMELQQMAEEAHPMDIRT